MTRAAELAEALARLRDRVSAAARAAGRDPDQVTLLPVTKFFPAADIRILAGLGCPAVAEARDQEAVVKVSQVPGLTWHMIGRLQRNKARSVARWADVVQSVDSVRLVDSLSAAATAERDGALRVLVQISLDDDPARGGVAASDVAELADRVAAAPGLELAGVMAVAPLGAEPDLAFAQLARVHERLLRDHPGAAERSAGMSTDLESAVRHGSTCVRVGTALLGPRQYSHLEREPQ